MCTWFAKYLSLNDCVREVIQLCVLSGGNLKCNLIIIIIGMLALFIITVSGENELTQQSTCNCEQHPGLISACDYHDGVCDGGDDGGGDGDGDGDSDGDGDGDCDGDGDDLLRAQAQQQMKTIRSKVEVANRLTVMIMIMI